MSPTTTGFQLKQPPLGLFGWILLGCLPEPLAAMQEGTAVTPTPCCERAICSFSSRLSGSCLQPWAGQR
jgi:hypothetical protein